MGASERSIPSTLFGQGVNAFKNLPFNWHQLFLPYSSLLLFSCSAVSDSLQPCGLQHARLPCPSLSFWVCLNSCPLSWWCHPAISSSVIPLSSCLHSFPGSGSFPMSLLFTSGGHSTEASASALVLPMNTQGWFPFINWFDLLAVQGTLKSLFQHHSSKALVLRH